MTARRLGVVVITSATYIGHESANNAILEIHTYQGYRLLPMSF